MSLIDRIPLGSGDGFDAFINAMKSGQSLANDRERNKLIAAQAQRAQAMANLPFGGTSLPGTAGQILGLEMLKRQYGENSPQYLQAKEAYELSQKAINSRVNYQDQLSGSLPIRYTTPQGRKLIEQSNVGQGASPTGTPEGAPVVPGGLPYHSPYGNAENAAGQYELSNLKNNVSSPILQKNLYATNMEKTLNNLNVDDLTAYSGAKGITQRAQDSIQSQTGKTPERYQKYQDALTASKILAKQVRQFYGDSITPQIQEGLNDLTNPSSWLKNPDIAKSKFNKFKSILEQEAQTYRDALKGGSVYMQAPKKSEANVSNPTSTDVIVLNKDGISVGTFDRKDAERLIKDHPDHSIREL